MNSTSAKLPALLIPEMFSNSRRATWIAIVPFSGKAVEMRGRMVSIPSGVSNTSQQGGGLIPARHFCSLPIIQPRRFKTIISGELKSLLETTPLFSQNNWGDLKVADAETKSADSRRVRKSRGEQASLKKVRHNAGRHSKTACNFLGTRMSVILVRLDFNQLCLRSGTKRRGGDLAVKLLRPAAGDWRVASRAITLRGHLVIVDEISVALD